MGTLLEDQYTFLNILLISFRMRNISEKSCRENQNTHFIFSDFFQKSYCLWDMLKNILELDRQHMTMWLMCIECWVSKATNTHSEYIILLIFHCNNGCMNTLQCYIICTLPVLLCSNTIIPELKWHLLVKNLLLQFCEVILIQDYRIFIL